MGTEETTSTPPDAVTYRGTWERRGRSLNAAAVAGLLGIGLLYSYGQSTFATIAMIAQGGFGTAFEEGGNLFAMLAHRAELAKNPIRISLLCSQFLLMLLPTLWIVRRWHTADVSAYLRLQPVSLRMILLAVLATVFFFPTNVYVSGLLVGGLNIPQELIEINQKVFTASSAGELLFLVIVVGLTPAICEETLFRGYAQRTFERTMGWKSILLVGLVFGLYHVQPLGLFSLSGLGVLFGYFYYASRSLVPGMAAHFTNNLLAVVSLSSAPTTGDVDLNAPSGEAVLLTLPLTVAMVYAFQKTLKKNATALLLQHPQSRDQPVR